MSSVWLCKYGLKSISVECCTGQISFSRELKFHSRINDMWVASQRDNEYNPNHWHSGCTISAVMYLKIPEYTPRNIKGKDMNTPFLSFFR